MTLRNENMRLAARIADEGQGTEGTEALVSARPPMTPYDMLVLDKGTDDAVYDGMRVYARGVFIGLIENASRQSSKASLFSAPGRETEAWVGDARIPITLQGAGAGSFRANAPREAAIAVGDTVYLPGAGATPAGVIASIDSHPSSPRSTLSIRPLVNIFSLSSVRVLPAPAP